MAKRRSGRQNARIETQAGVMAGGALIPLLGKITPNSIYFIAKAFIYTFTTTLGITHPRVSSDSYYLH